MRVVPMSAEVRPGDCRDTLRTMAALGEQFDSVVTDPPYDLVSIVKRFGGAGAAPVKHGTDGLYARQSAGFMGKKWDGTGVAFDPDTWRLVMDVMKPGAQLVAFGGSRTHHRMATAIEDAGFEIRDSLMWLYGSGFPKSHDVSKGIDKAAGAVREVVGLSQNSRATQNIGARGFDAAIGGSALGGINLTAPATPEAVQWAGWGTALKPAFELITLARKPLGRNTVAANVLEFGTGALNIDACRVAFEGCDTTASAASAGAGSGQFGPIGFARGIVSPPHALGRWPANVLHDGSEEVLEAFARFGESKSSTAAGRYCAGAPSKAKGAESARVGFGHGDSGTAARFFYCAKANAADRAGSKHPTVKPQALMRWLCRLITPPGGRVLDPFAGSGSTLQAALACGFGASGCEADPGYGLDIHARLRAAENPADAQMRVEAERKCKNLKEDIHQIDLEEYLAGVRNGA